MDEDTKRMIVETHNAEKVALRTRIAQLETSLRVIRGHRQVIMDLLPAEAFTEINNALHVAEQK